ncbi:MAG TPA: SMP-30/gluconolactonase/LRE family protein, partial [Polyangiaceae bacterium]
MKNPWKPLKWAGALVAMTFGVAGIAALRFGGAFRSIEPAFAGTCRSIALGGSSEDIAIDRRRGIAYLSLLERDSARHDEQVLGTVMLLDLNRPEPAPRAAMAFDPEGFRPQGLSLLATGSQPARLFVVSDRPGSPAVEISEEAAAGGFFPRETIRNAAFVHPNAIAATGARQFYLTNGPLTEGQWALATQALWGSGRSTLVYFDGDEARIEVADLNFPSGLALSPDGSRLYVAEMLARQLRIYRRNAASGALGLEEAIDLDAAPGNIDVDGDGVVWIAAYPKLLSLAAHWRDPGNRSPTQVLRFDPKTRGLTETYMDPGAAISAGSAVASWHDEFLIGAPFDRKVLICKPS